jgi:hypothetical protein
MYRDKTARKRLGAASRTEDPVSSTGPEGMSELDLTRAASGIL